MDEKVRAIAVEIVRNGLQSAVDKYGIWNTDGEYGADLRLGTPEGLYRTTSSVSATSNRYGINKLKADCVQQIESILIFVVASSFSPTKKRPLSTDPAPPS